MLKQATIDKNTLVELSNRSYELDELIQSAQGTPGASKRAQIKALMAENTVDVAPVVSFLSSEETVDSRFAVWEKIKAAVDEAFEEEFDSFVKSLVKSEAVAAKVSNEELETLITERRGVAQQYNAIVSVFHLLCPGEDISDIKPPKKMTGLRGSRGPRAISFYQFAINGSKCSADENSLPAIAKRIVVATPDGNVPWKASELRAFCIDQAKTRGQEFSWKTPPDHFSFTLPGDITFEGSKMEASEADDSDEDDDNE